MYNCMQPNIVDIIMVDIECKCWHIVVIDDLANLLVNKPLTMDRMYMFLSEIVCLTCIQNVVPKKCDKMIYLLSLVKSSNGMNKYNNDHC